MKKIIRFEFSLHFRWPFSYILSWPFTLDSGVSLSELNVGAVQTGKDRQFVTSGVALSKEEFDCLQEIQQTGLKVYIQPIPENEKLSLESIANKIK